MRQNGPPPSYNPTGLSYEHTRFGDDVSTLTEEGAQLPKIGILQWKLHFSRHNLPPEDEGITEKQQHRVWVYFSLIFKYLIVFIIAIWEKVELNSCRERYQKLIPVIFDICDATERVYKIILKFGLWIYTDTVLFYLLPVLVPLDCGSRS